MTSVQYWLVTFDGTLLRKHRRERELSQQGLSNRSRVSPGTIQRIEQLPAAFSHVGTLQRLVAALSPEDPDALIAELAGGSGNPQPRRPLPRLRAVQWWEQRKPVPVNRAQQGHYDTATAGELLAMTGEFPNTKAALLILLTEYRRALYDIAVEHGGTKQARCG